MDSFKLFLPLLILAVVAAPRAWAQESSAPAEAPPREVQEASSSDAARSDAEATAGSEAVPSASSPSMDEQASGGASPSTRAGGLTLERAQEIALTRSPTLLATMQEIERSEALIRQAWAALYPFVAGNFQYVMADQPTVVSFDMGAASLFGPAQEIVVRQQHVATVGLVARQSVFNGQAINGVRLANAARDLTELSVEQARRQLAFGVAQAFYAVITSRRTLELIERNIVLAQEDLNAARARLDAQVGLAHDVARAELEVERYRSQRESALLAYESTRDALALLMGVEPDELPELSEPTPPSIEPDEDVEDFVHRAMDERLDLLAARRQTRLAELDLDSVWTSFAPSLDLTWSLSHTLSDLGGFGDRRTSWNLVVALNVPLLSGGLRIGQIRDRRARIRQAELAEEAIRRSAATEVRRSYRAWRTALATLAISQHQLELARETNRLIRASFAAGAATSLDLVDSQRMLAAAEIDVEIRRLSSQMALIELLSRQEIGAQAGAGAMGSSASDAR